MDLILEAGAQRAGVWMFEWERQALIWINSHHHWSLDLILIPVSIVGELGACWIALILSLMIWGRREYKVIAVRLGLTMLMTSLFIVIPMRLLFPRERPYEVLPQIRQLGVALSGASFPSGHAQSASLVAVALGVCLRPYAIPLAVFALLVCYSRVYCGMHYPLDVLVGSGIGIIVGTVLLQVETRNGKEITVMGAGKSRNT